MRTFFALELPSEIALQIAAWRDRQLGQPGRPIPPANFHITLAFLGDLGESSLERLGHAVDGWLAVAEPAGGQLRLDCAGYWPRPGIFWLGAQTWPESLTRLADRLRQLGTAAGARRDRNAFRPHVTLFRNCRTPPPAPASTPGILLPYRHFSLFESQQGRHGVRYVPLAQWQLTNQE